MASRNPQDLSVFNRAGQILLTTLVFLIIAPVFFAHTTERRSAVVEVVETVGPAVVNIRTEQIVRQRSRPFFGFGDTFFNEFFNQFGSTRTYKTQSLGSGAIIDQRGYLLTNAHVVAKATKIYVALLDDKQEREATLVGIDESTDLAVIKVATDKPLPSLKLGRSDDLMLGETVIAIGNPLGLENSVTTGVVSAPLRRLPDGEGGVAIFIQTDALINPGNSGGPLINIKGELIGINTAIAQQAQGIGFAIPIKTARRIAADLIEYGRVRTVYTGILPGDISQTMVQSRGAGGALVKDIDRDSPAAKAGLKLADVILALDGTQVENGDEFHSIIRTYAPGDKITLEVLRGVDLIKVMLKVDELPTGYVGQYVERIFGLRLANSQKGLLVDTVIRGSPAAEIEMMPGDLIAEVDGAPVSSLVEFNRVVEKSLGRLPLRFLVVRGNRGYLIKLP